jgi:hypothetical protein
MQTNSPLSYAVTAWSINQHQKLTAKSIVSFEGKMHWQQINKDTTSSEQ